MHNSQDIIYIELEKIKASVNYVAPAVFIFGAVTFTVTILSLNGDDMYVFASLLYPLAICAFIIYLVLKNMAVKEERQKQLQLFAIDNSFAYLTEKKYEDGKSGTLFEHGHSRKFNDVISGTFHSLPFELSNYRYTVGSGKNQTTYNARVMEFTLPRAMPHIVIDSLVEQDDLSRSTLPIEFDSSQRITLEGDFSQFFHLYAPDSYGVTALTILAPDAMMALLKFAALCDMEIKDNKLYFYWPGTADSVQEYQTVFETTAVVLDEIGEKLTKADVFGSASQAAIHSQPGHGVRLEKSFWSKYGALIGVSGFIAVYLLQLSGNSSLFGVTYSMVFIAPIAYAMYRASKRRGLRKKLAERYHQ